MKDNIRLELVPLDCALNCALTAQNGAASRVDSADHPEFRSYLFGKLRKVRVPYRTVKHQYFYHVVQGYLPIFKIPRDPHGDLPSLHTLDDTRTERDASVLEPCAARADGHRASVGPNVPLQRQQPG